MWTNDRMLLDDLVFQLEQEKNNSSGSERDCFRFYKGKWTVDQYAGFWSTRRDFAADRVFEVGIWDGGSTAFWVECFHPKKHVAIDILPRRDSEYFDRYIASRGLDSRVKTYWGVDQGDSGRLRAIVAREFEAPLDLVIDDASHMYPLTKATFETLFPLLRPGGLYIIEDWAWSLWKEFHAPDHPWIRQPQLTRLILEIAEAVGSTQTFAGRIRLPEAGPETCWRTLMNSVTIFPHFAAVERGDLDPGQLDDFQLESYISRRPPDTTRRALFHRLVTRLRR